MPRFGVRWESWRGGRVGEGRRESPRRKTSSGSSRREKRRGRGSAAENVGADKTPEGAAGTKVEGRFADGGKYDRIQLSSTDQYQTIE